jgi:hypothetical protein
MKVYYGLVASDERCFGAVAYKSKAAPLALAEQFSPEVYCQHKSS